jgi:hypothetical protein
VERDLVNGAVVAALGVLGLVVFLSLAEISGAHWLYWPGIGCLFIAFIGRELGLWGRRGLFVAGCGLLAVFVGGLAISLIG